MEVREFALRDVPEVAVLHIHGIGTGFISSLGSDFVTALYEAIAKNKSSFGFVAEENERIVGFVAFTTNINKLYISVILKKGFYFAFLLAGKMLSFKTLKKVLETLFYPSKTKKMNLPSAEFLSMAIVKDAQRKGLATTLMREGFAECARRGIKRVQMLVGADNEAANKLYRKCGFKLVGETESHGVKSNIYTPRTDHFEIKHL